MDNNLIFASELQSCDIGLVIVIALHISGYFQHGVRQSAEAENLMTSVERVLEYTKLDSEAPLETDQGS